MAVVQRFISVAHELSTTSSEASWHTYTDDGHSRSLWRTLVGIFLHVLGIQALPKLKPQRGETFMDARLSFLDFVPAAISMNCSNNSSAAADSMVLAGHRKNASADSRSYWPRACSGKLYNGMGQTSVASREDRERLGFYEPRQRNTGWIQRERARTVSRQYCANAHTEAARSASCPYAHSDSSLDHSGHAGTVILAIESGVLAVRSEEQYILWNTA